MSYTRIASWLVAALIPSPALRDAVLGDFAELLASSGPRALWRELGCSLPSFLRARLLAADPLAAIALALFTVSPMLIAEWVCAQSLSLVPFKASPARPLWFAVAASSVPAALAWFAARDRSGAPSPRSPHPHHRRRRRSPFSQEVPRMKWFVRIAKVLAGVLALAVVVLLGLGQTASANRLQGSIEINRPPAEPPSAPTEPG